MTATLTAPASTRPTAPPAPKPARTLSDRGVLGLLAALVAATGLSFAFRGPNFIVDDWYSIDYRWAHGLLGTGGGLLRPRPGAWLTYIAEFGLIGRHPLVLYLLQLAIAVAIAYVLFRVCACHLRRGVAFAIAAVWVMLPTHTSLTHWVSTMNIQLGLLGTLVGILLLERALDEDRSPWTAILTLSVAALFYEATIPLAGAALLFIPWFRGRRPSLGTLVRWELPLVATAAWMFFNTQHVDGGWFKFKYLFPSNFGWGVTFNSHAGQVVGFVVILAIVIVLVSRFSPTLRALVPDEARWLVGVGLVVVVLGILAFARYPTDPAGLGDRVNAVSAFGAAAVWVGLGMAIWRKRTVGLLLAAAMLLNMEVAHLNQDRDYAMAGQDALKILTAVDRAYPTNPKGVIVVGPRAVFRGAVVGLIGASSVAAQSYLKRPGLEVDVGTWKEYETVPPSMRLDIRKVLAGRS